VEYDASKDGVRWKFETTSERICENTVDDADVDELWTAIKKGIEDTGREEEEKISKMTMDDNRGLGKNGRKKML